MPFCITAEPVLEKKIGDDLHLIQEAILGTMGNQVLSIVLTGGYGRGEGGIAWRDSTCVPVNDYDLVVVTKNMPLPIFLVYRSKIQRLGEKLTEQFGLGIDLALTRKKMLPTMPPSLFWYETQKGHYMVWGEKDILMALPRWHPQDIPLSEGTRLLLNRGAMLLVARAILTRSNAPSAREVQTILTAAWKAVLSWGDCVLLMNGRYDHRYQNRKNMIHAHSSLDDIPNGELLPEFYSQALHYKFFQEHLGGQPTDMIGWITDVIKQHERIFRWFEEKRLGRPIANWNEYATWVPKLPLPGSFVGRAKNLVRNVWQGGWLAMHGRVKWAMADHQERLLSSFPILLFQPTSEGLVWCTQALGHSMKNVQPVSWDGLVRKFQKAWH